ncbi:MAG: hypothetical protein V1837_05080 [Candidatus Woesearchaeota archaeon]
MSHKSIKETRNLIMNYSSILVIKSSFIKPSDVPRALPHWESEDLVEKGKGPSCVRIVPEEVRQFFELNPKQEQFVHYDGFVYSRPHTQTRQFLNQPAARRAEILKVLGGDYYGKSWNMSANIVSLFDKDQPIGSLTSELEKAVRTQVNPADLLAGWQFDKALGAHKLPEADSFCLCFDEAGRQNPAVRVCGIDLYCQGPRIHQLHSIQRLLTIGSVHYRPILQKH